MVGNEAKQGTDRTYWACGWLGAREEAFQAGACLGKKWLWAPRAEWMMEQDRKTRKTRSCDSFHRCYGASTILPLKTKPGTREANRQSPCPPGAGVLAGETHSKQVFKKQRGVL